MILTDEYLRERDLDLETEKLGARFQETCSPSLRTPDQLYRKIAN